MNNISYISNPHQIISYESIEIKKNENLDLELDNILKSCGIRSRSSSNDKDDSLPKSDSFKKNEQNGKDNINNEMYCSESSNFPNIPFGSTPPDTHRIRELYIQYMSHIQLKNKMYDDETK
jgi:hypothetical protein